MPRSGAAASKKKAAVRAAEPKHPVGVRVAKEFGGVPYSGIIVGYDPSRRWYAIEYDDGDAEELEEGEVDDLLVDDVDAEKAATDDDAEKGADSSKRGRRRSGGGAARKRVRRGAAAAAEGDGGRDEKEEEEDAETEGGGGADADAGAVSTPSGRPSRRGRRAVNYSVEKMLERFDSGASSSSSEDSDFERPARRKGKAANGKRKAANGKKKAAGGKRKAADGKKKAANGKRRAGAPQCRGGGGSDDDDDDSFAAASSSSDSEDVNFDSDDEEDGASSDDDVAFSTATKKAGGRRRRGGKGGSGGAKSSAGKKATAAPAKDGGKGKVKMCEAFQPINSPLYPKLSLDEIEATKGFLDPCGMEATDDIIDRLVGDQVDRIWSLLVRALEGEDSETRKKKKTKAAAAGGGAAAAPLGSESRPLLLGTACSGTDAPALALTLVQEQLELRGRGDLFRHGHAFSCEVDPFKQAYLARNFDSVLYPDVAKLCDDPPRDVYGREQPLPDFNLFVAGTSCKNFSMLRSKRRIDIEDRGCSGETFLAACEVLFREKPKFAIFENVIGAPWTKMSEYITHRIKLSECDSSKAVKEIKDKKADLTFIYDKKTRKIIVEKVPAIYGVRCGAAVDGFLRPGSSKVRPVSWPSAKKQTCTLAELIRANGISKADDTLAFETDVTYCTRHLKVDTKQFGLPQTRQRTYMFVWRPEGGGDNDDAAADVNDDLGEYWEAIVRHLESPVRHSLESFILRVDHDIIRVFREALNGPAGRQTRRGVNQRPDFWTSSDANLPHNKIARRRLGLRDTSRSLTSWGPFGRMKIPPHYWLEYLRLCDQRQLDLLEILHSSSARDAECHDSNFASFFWNVSQNASKEKHRSATPGIAGCITPGGDVFLPHAGRPLLGCEKLLLQGIPYFRLLLGNETEVQLGDLAGNAMSLTVVCAAMLGAATCERLRREHRRSRGGRDVGEILSGARRAGIAESDAEREGSEGGARGAAAIVETTSAAPLFRDLAALSPDAIGSSIWCTCETSGRNSLSSEFLLCEECGASCCRDCCGTTQGYRLDGHAAAEVRIAKGEHDMGTFEMRLRNLVPPTLVFSEAGWDAIARIDGDRYRVTGLSGRPFHLHRIRRDRMRWLVIYYARECDGVGEAVAEFRITVGELRRGGGVGDAEMGMRGELTSFLPAKTAPLVYGPLPPCATITVRRGEEAPADENEWTIRSADAEATLVLRGEGTTDSFRTEAGLTDAAAADLRENSEKNLKRRDFSAAKRRGEERRWVYPKNWREWPRVIEVEDGGEDDGGAVNLGGRYERAGCRQTVNQSAMWIRRGGTTAADDPTLYILLKPDVSRTGPDRGIITTSASHDDDACVLARLPRTWDPCDCLRESSRVQRRVRIAGRMPAPAMECRVVRSDIAVASPAPEEDGTRGDGDDDGDELVRVTGLRDADVASLCRGAAPVDGGLVRLNVLRGQTAQQTVRVFNSLCAAPILRHAAGGGLPRRYDLRPDAPWIDLPPRTAGGGGGDGAPFGTCPIAVPPRPAEEWTYDEERGAWERRSEPGASRRYYLALRRAPRAFEFLVDRSKRSLSVGVFPGVEAHRAAHSLIEGRGGSMEDEVTVMYRLSGFQEDPVLDRFRLHNCDAFGMTAVPLRAPHRLYDRQMRAATKMLEIEDGGADFEEIEMSEQAMPGSTGWSLIARASRRTRLKGGVIADAIGAGKTVISIAIVLRGIQRARAARARPNRSSATLVVVPPGLIDQWRSEIRKFTESVTAICVYDTDSIRRLRVKDILEADVVICPVDILEARDYMSNLVGKAAGDENVGEVPQLPRYTGQIEKNGAAGVWIPATSQDPYGGANNPRNQQRRNESAYYTYVYLKMVERLRTRTFKETERGVPLEFFEWERIFVDEIHECLCTTKDELTKAKAEADEDSGFFQEKNRRAGRELLGITMKDVTKRPLIFRSAIFGLTATPLLDNSNRVIELANLMGNAYVIGLSSHWRKLERESCRDIFLHNYLEPKQSREVRKNIYAKCQDYLNVACCKNKNEEDMEGIKLETRREVVRMTREEAILYKKSQSGINPSAQSFAIRPEDFDVTAGHDISKFLRQNAKLASRGEKLVSICKEILSRRGDENTKIIVFTDGRIGAGDAARDVLLAEDGLGCTWLDGSDSVKARNEKLAWYQRGDVTEEDRARPRILVLHFEHAAGLNLQAECHNLVLFVPLYVGEGGTSGDAVGDASTELQAIGRVFRPGQTKPEVRVYRIEVQGPDGEECLDGHLIRRNTDEETIAMAVNADD